MVTQKRCLPCQESDSMVVEMEIKVVFLSTSVFLWKGEKKSAPTHYESESSHCSATFHSLWPYGLWTARLLCPWNSLSKNTGMGCHSLLQRIFPTQGSNPDLLHAGKLFTIWATGKTSKVISEIIKLYISLKGVAKPFRPTFQGTEFYL